MKKLLLLLFLPLSLFAQKRDSVYVQNKVFTLVYSEVLEQPKWVKYKVTCAENNVSRKGLDFYKEKTVIDNKAGEDHSKFFCKNTNIIEKKQK